LSEFREPCYWGETAGSEVYFKAEDGDYLGVAGLYNVWKSQGTEKFYSMTFLMRPPSTYVMEHGHHRQPFSPLTGSTACGNGGCNDTLIVTCEDFDLLQWLSAVWLFYRAATLTALNDCEFFSSMQINFCIRVKSFELVQRALRRR
jgi:hypothetical protein